MEEFKPTLSKKEEKIRKKIQSEIKYCDYDQPYDSGDVIWIYGDKIDLYDMLSAYDISEASMDKIVDHLYCPGCGNEYLELMSSIGTETAYEKELDIYYSKASKLFINEVDAFEKELEQYPLLALNNKIAKSIFKEIEKETLPITSVKGTFFRARRVESSEIYNTEKMYHPPIGKSNEGRFNHSGQSHLYLANAKETAIKEVIAQDNALLVWTQEFLIENPVDKILDLSFDWSMFSTSTKTLLVALNIDNSLRRSERNIDNWKPDYFLTRFIMDCARKFGYKGIKYNSAKGYGEYDLVLFYPQEIDIIAQGKPMIEIFQGSNESNELYELP